jgi:hypothetical protein
MDRLGVIILVMGDGLGRWDWGGNVLCAIWGLLSRFASSRCVLIWGEVSQRESASWTIGGLVQEMRSDRLVSFGNAFFKGIRSRTVF